MNAETQPIPECNDNDSPWLICKTCAAEGKCKQAEPQPEPEPVAYKVWHPANPKCSYVGTEPPSEFRADTGEPDEYFGGRVVPLYAAPQSQQPQPSPMSEQNRLIAYSAAQKLRDLGYEWDEAAEDWVKK